MVSQILPRVDHQIKKYQDDHNGEKPLYILVSDYEADDLYSEVKQAGGYEQDIVVTSYKGSKIVKYASLKKGDLLLTNELPDTGS